MIEKEKKQRKLNVLDFAVHNIRENLNSLCTLTLALTLGLRLLPHLRMPWLGNCGERGDCILPRN